MTTPFTIRFESAEIAGESDGFGLPVVFLHAGVADRRMWASQLQAVAGEGYHVVAYDRRGYGETQSPDEPFSHVVDLEAVLDQLDIHAAVLVGASLGGALAVDFALEHPERVIGLVLVNTALTGSEEPEWPETAEALLDARDYAAERGSWTTANRIDAHLWLDGPLSEQGRVEGEVRELFLAMNGTILERPGLTEAEEPEAAVDAVSQITAPVLLIAGALDFPHIIERHEMLSEELPNAFAIMLEDTAHLPSLERPDIFDPLLVEFLEAISGVSEGPADDEDDEDDSDDDLDADEDGPNGFGRD
jgi:pimeloyl-ACP methyl ester carboxylesterase